MSSGAEQDRRSAIKTGKKLLGKSTKLAKKAVVGTGKLTAKTAVGELLKSDCQIQQDSSLVPAAI
jgi:hypothetical protein